MTTTIQGPVSVHRTAPGLGGAPEADPITTEVIRHGLDAAADQMRIVMHRTAFSPVIYEMTDFAAALYDKEVRLLAQAKALPLFLGTLSFAIEAALRQIGGADKLSEGDIIWSTYGYDIGSHQQDACVIQPAFYDGEIVGYAIVKAHHMDIGAKDPYCTDTVDIFQEGAIFPSVWLYRKGERQEDMYRTVVANSRMPEALVGDLNAQIGATRAALDGLYRLLDRYGVEQFGQCVERMFAHGEATIRQFFEALPDGRYTGSGCIDDNGIDDDLIPYEIGVEVSGSDVTIDFSGSPPIQRGPMNAPQAATVSCARMAIMSLAGAHETANEGHFRPIEVRTKPGTMFHALPPAPIFMYGWPAMQGLEVIHQAFAKALPDRVPAGSGNDLCGWIWWELDEDGSIAWGDGHDHSVGHGASAVGDADAPLMTVPGSGIRPMPIETIEAKRPVVAERYELEPDSGGIGKHRGGPGVIVRWRTKTDLVMTTVVERTKTAPGGLFGGGPALPNRLRVYAPDGEFVTYSKITAVPLAQGSVVEMRTGGGGGYGPPSERDSAAVLADVKSGIVSEQAARRDYPHAF